MNEWLNLRRALVAELSHLLCASFEAAARFDGPGFASLIEQQEEACRQIAQHDRRQPAFLAGSIDLDDVASELLQMNEELRQLSNVLAALVERGSRSARCFQRVMALGAPSYEAPTC